MRTQLVLFLFAAAAFAAPEALEISPTQTSLLPGGKEADGIIGDFLLRNDRIEAVISGDLPLRRANMSTFYGESGITPGCIFDLTLRGANNDQLTIFSPAQQQGSISWVRVSRDGRDGEAVIECVSTAALHDGLMRKHEYRLRDGWQGVLVTTTITNESWMATKFTSMDRWTNFKRTGSALGIAWADAVDPADRTGYAYGLTQSSEGFAPANPFELAPGASVSFSRFLAVGRSALEAVGAVSAQRGAVGQVVGTVRDSLGKAIDTVQVVVRSLGTVEATVGIGQVGSDGSFAFALPPGQYTLELNDLGRPSTSEVIEIREGMVQQATFSLAAAAAIQFDIRDEAGRSIPCKAQFLAEEGTELVNLGPEMRAHGCRDQYHSERGDFRVALPPGRYRVVITRGVEYSHLEQKITVQAGQTVPIAGKLRRIVDTRGWVSADYHNHSTQSGDNVCGKDDRIINLVAEGIEFAPTTEHNRLYDWRPHIERLGLAAELQTVSGMELTGSAAHLNSFPFQPRPYTQDNGAPVWNKDPRIAAITLRDWQGIEPDRWVQINHPDMAANFVDGDADGIADGGFRGLATLIDGIETENGSDHILYSAPFRIGRGRNGEETVVEVREFVWLQMLNRGHRYAAMGVADAHTVWGNGVGAWRMYMPSASDEPAKIDWRENVGHAKAGRSILTTGPFLTVQTDDGTLPGGVTRARNGGVTLRVKVQCTDWIEIDRVQVLVNGRQVPALNFTRAKTPERFGSGVVKFDQEIFVQLEQDAHIIVVVRGENSNLSAGYGTSSQSRLHPTAYNNPIFVDLDGGGFTPNNDNLDWPLAAKKPKLADVKAQLAARGLPAAPEAIEP